jgi:hypothetical protein
VWSRLYALLITVCSVKKRKLSDSTGIRLGKAFITLVDENYKELM